MAQYWALGSPWYLYLLQGLLLCWAFIPVPSSTGRYAFTWVVFVLGLGVLWKVVYQQSKLPTVVSTPLSSLYEHGNHLTQWSSLVQQTDRVRFVLHSVFVTGGVLVMAALFMMFTGPVPGVLLMFVSRLEADFPIPIEPKERFLAVVWAVMADGSLLTLGQRAWVDVDLRAVRWLVLVLIPIVYRRTTWDTALLGSAASIVAFMDLFSETVRWVTGGCLVVMGAMLWLFGTLQSRPSIGLLFLAAATTDLSASYLGTPLESVFVALLILPTIDAFGAREFTVVLEPVALGVFVTGIAQVLWNSYYTGVVLFAVVGTIDSAHVLQPVYRAAMSRGEVRRVRDEYRLQSSSRPSTFEFAQVIDQARRQRAWFTESTRLLYISRAWFFLQTMLGGILFEVMWLVWYPHDQKLVRLHRFVQIWIVAWIGLCCREMILACHTVLQT